MRKDIIDITGQKFGRLTVIEHIPGTKPTLWLCQCECGNYCAKKSVSLRKGRTHSCGCYQRDVARSKVKHGDSVNGKPSHLYSVWKNMMRRCYSEYSKSYKNYGALGVSVCEEWRGPNGYCNFKKWSFENGYQDDVPGRDCSLDRIDPFGNYEPSNCRWADRETQSNNKRDTIRIEHNGVTKSLSQWCRQYGVIFMTARGRHKRGLPFEKIFGID